MKSILIKTYEETGYISRARLLRLHPNEWLNDRDLGILADYFHICIEVYDTRIAEVTKYQNESDFLIPNFTSIGPNDCTEKIYLIQKPNHFDYLSKSV